HECGFMWNATFDIKLVAYQDYAFSLNQSPAYQKHLTFLISHLQKNYEIHNAKILEIGCGDAHALYTIAKATDSKGIGYEPSFAKRNLNLPDDFNDYVEVVSEYYNESALHKDADVILCRHVLEHVPEPLEFLESINQTLRKGGKNPLVVFEVPYIKNSLSKETCYQFIYEHCNYFSPKSLVKIFENAGFEVLDIFQCFEKGVFQILFARLKSHDLKDYSCEDKSLFTENTFDLKAIQETCQRLKSFENVAIWCAGNSSQVFYHLLGSPKQIRCFIDLNPEKQGNFMAVSGLPILSPKQAIEKGIRAVIVGNATYDLEVPKMIKEHGYPFEVI
ncbi:MAG: methyltransferase domain-containing protein, partial [Helicobacter sp.]|nr:methyltransferase domain-containing protein [Helicobacter sp.]